MAQASNITRTRVAWAARLAFALACLALIAPAGPRVALGPQQTVDTRQPKLCVHTRLMDEVDEWKVQRSLQMTREMGAGTIVEFFPWAYIEQAPGQYDWSGSDRIFRHARQQGIRVIARMGYVPAWARDGAGEHSTLNTLPARSYADFARFSASFAERYQDDLSGLVIWNEPNLAFEWGYETVSPEGYVALLEAVYPAVKAAAPAVPVLAAPLAPNLEPAGSALAMNDLDYLRAAYDAGLADVSDGLAMHTYGFTTPPDEGPSPGRLNYRRAELLRDIQVAHGDGDSPVFITETGWNDSDRWAYGVSPAQRIDYTLSALEMAATEWSWADAVCLWVLRTPAPTLSYPDLFTLLNTEFRPGALYNAVRAWARGEQTDEALWLPAPRG